MKGPTPQLYWDSNNGGLASCVQETRGVILRSEDNAWSLSEAYLRNQGSKRLQSRPGSKTQLSPIHYWSHSASIQATMHLEFQNNLSRLNNPYGTPTPQACPITIEMRVQIII